MTKEEIEKEYNAFEGVPKNVVFLEKKRFLTEYLSDTREAIKYHEKRLEECRTKHGSSFCKDQEMTIEMFKKEYNRVGRAIDRSHGLI